MTVYWAAPLFTDAECAWNRRQAQLLRNAGFVVILPQEENANCRIPEPGWQQRVFEVDRDGVRRVDVVVAVLDGADVDSGTAWEVGYACALGKPVIGLRTDIRSEGSEPVNLMLTQSVAQMVTVADDLRDVLREMDGRPWGGEAKPSPSSPC
jgi:nucleoside 2-deoxyribosyltransferase